ncbi:MAG: tRNA guanosine(34) transglycosylase Tgt [Candidatus Latescibacterota bacterium]|nr:tRNA guanosine(34) transglycosylase Tgt [Candidatus Latescibacterota bacterium]
MKNKRLKLLSTPHGELTLPSFLPDATRGVVRTIDADDAKVAGVEALMVNTLHLSMSPGTSLIQDAGGMHAFMGWDGPIASDSGGFQIYSLASGGAKGVSISPGGVTFKIQGQKKRRSLTPEKCIQLQFQLGTDIMFALDDCPLDNADEGYLAASVDRTLAWGKSCREVFNKQTAGLEASPLLFAVIQGGDSLDQRRRCVEGLLDIGFDGFGFGGWPIADSGTLVDEVAAVAEMLPDGFPLHGLGIGKPDNIVAAHQLGYDTFDCTIPTRDARRGRLYVSEPDDAPGKFDYCRIERESFARDHRPVEPHCDCLCCTQYTRAYLHHLSVIGDPTYHRLSTIHNLRFFTQTIERLREDE